MTKHKLYPPAAWYEIKWTHKGDRRKAYLYRRWRSEDGRKHSEYMGEAPKQPIVPIE